MGGFGIDPNSKTKITIMLSANIMLSLEGSKHYSIDDLYSIAARRIREGNIERCGVGDVMSPARVIISIDEDGR